MKKLILFMLVSVLVFAMYSCTKENVEPCVEQVNVINQQDLIGDYQVPSVMYIDSQGVEDVYNISSMEISVSNSTIDIISNGVVVEQFNYTISHTTVDEAYINIISANGCYDYKIKHDTLNAYYYYLPQHPSDSDGCHRVFKSIKN